MTYDTFLLVPYGVLFVLADGSEPYKAKKHRLQLNVTEVGSERFMSTSGQCLPVRDLDSTILSLTCMLFKRRLSWLALGMSQICIEIYIKCPSFGP